MQAANLKSRPIGYRALGRTGLDVSEAGFGAWGIGGKSYGAVTRRDALDALARAEDLGCNFLDTAMVYGDSEAVAGEFLAGRRDRWRVCTKYSGQPEGLARTLDRQLTRLRTDAVDLYLLHWVPHRQSELWEDLRQARSSGKTRCIGASVYSSRDLDVVLGIGGIDCVMIAFSLLDPFPFAARLAALRRSGVGVIIRSVLKEGFLTGKYSEGAVFPDLDDQRHQWSKAQIAETAARAGRFGFLAGDAGTMAVAAIRYPLSFAEVSTVVLGTKSAAQAQVNFGDAPRGRLSAASLAQIERVQWAMKLGSARERWTLALRRWLGA